MNRPQPNNLQREGKSEGFPLIIFVLLAMIAIVFGGCFSSPSTQTERERKRIESPSTSPREQLEQYYDDRELGIGEEPYDEPIINYWDPL